MRRSAAPSQACGRPKFVAPFKEHVSPRANISTCLTNNSEHRTDTTECKVLKRVFTNSSCAVNAVNESTVSEDHSKPDCLLSNNDENTLTTKKLRFNAPHALKLQNFAAITQKVENHQDDNLSLEELSGKQRYFSVVWCKRSNKKHKKWEGDAVLVTSGRCVTLYDIEGKEIGKGTGYKSTELALLAEDQTLPIGGKEIQVMSHLTADQFKSGKCFLGVPSCTVTDAVPLARSVSKPFSQPQKCEFADNIPTLYKAETTVIQPLYNPLNPGALVMPRPTASHQWQYNKKGLQVVDVVVDPYISHHLRAHQRDGVTFLYECVMGYRNFAGNGAILADDMGLGKTLQCISLIWTLYKQGPYGGKPVARMVLIITPGSLVKNWYHEFKKWLGSERLPVYAVSSDNKVEEFVKTSLYPVLIISYEMFVRMYETLQKPVFDLIVCDEGHRLKNTTIKTTSLIMSLNTKCRVVLTGTPIQNDLQEFYSIVEFCNPGVLGSSAAFRRVYEDPIVAGRQPGATQEEISLGEERAAELSRMTQMFVLRRTQEINNKYLPPKREIVIFCRPTDLQLRLYQQLLSCQLIRSCLSGNMSGSPHLVCIAALKQLCNHPSLIYSKSVEQRSHEQSKTAYDDDGGDNGSVYRGLYSLFPKNFTPDHSLEDHSGKLSVLGCLLHQIHTADKNEKIVVVSNHTKTLDFIQKLCDHKSYRYLRLDGQTPTSKRQDLINRFNSRHSQEFIFLLSSKAGGVGLNLIGGSRLVLYDIDWNPANDMQAMARIWRDGQKHVVYIYRLLTTGTIEEKVYQRQISKQGLSGAVMDVIGSKADVNFSQEDLKDLFSINLTTDCDTHDLLNCDCGTAEHMSPQQSSQAVLRPCQLGGLAKTQNKKNLGMSELMEWKHYPGVVVQDHPSWYLREAIDHISFVFYSEVKGNG